MRQIKLERRKRWHDQTILLGVVRSVPANGHTIDEIARLGKLRGVLRQGAGKADLIDIGNAFLAQARDEERTAAAEQRAPRALAEPDMPCVGKITLEDADWDLLKQKLAAHRFAVQDDDDELVALKAAVDGATEIKAAVK